jgi:hypothetical protein
VLAQSNTVNCEKVNHPSCNMYFSLSGVADKNCNLPSLKMDCPFILLQRQGLFSFDDVIVDSSLTNHLLEEAPHFFHDIEPVPISSSGVEIVPELSVQNDPKILQAGNAIIDAEVIRSFIVGARNFSPQQNKNADLHRHQEHMVLSSSIPQVVHTTRSEVSRDRTPILGTRKRTLEQRLGTSDPHKTFSSENEGSPRMKKKTRKQGCNDAPLGLLAADRPPPPVSSSSDDVISCGHSSSWRGEEEHNCYSDSDSSSTEKVTTSCNQGERRLSPSSALPGRRNETERASLVFAEVTKNPKGRSSGPPWQSQTRKWYNRYQQLLHFKAAYGHCSVPNSFLSSDPALVQWVKRQRHQYTLKMEGVPSTLSNRRQQSLDEIGFVWDSHLAAWMERFNQLAAYCEAYGHCNVPTRWEPIHKLSGWVKSQRRQYKLYTTGGRSTITAERISMMNSLNFDWNPRRLRTVDKEY